MLIMSQNERLSRQWSPSSVPEDMEKPVALMLRGQRTEVVICHFELLPKPRRPRRPSGLGYAAASLFATGTRRYQEAARQLREHGEALATERLKRAWLKLNRQEGQLQFSIPDAMADAYAAAGARLFYGLT